MIVTTRHATTPEDWNLIRELCCLTGNGGNPIDRERWPFFSEFWIGPYERLIPDWTYVAESEGKVIGYLTGCPDTRSFAKRRFVRWRLPLLGQVLTRKYASNGDTRRFLKRTLGIEKSPEERFSRKILRKLYRESPAHLHMNVRDEFRKTGAGTALIESFVRDLRTRCVPGIHLFCGIGPVPFYERLKFHEVAHVEFTPGVKVYAMAHAIR